MIVKKIAYNTIISAGARVLGLALSLITLGYLTRYLGQSGFGQYSTILAYLYIFSVLSDLGLYSICVRDISRPDTQQEKIVANTFSIRITFSLIFFIVACLLALVFPYSVETKIGIAIGAFSFWFLSGQQVLMGIFQKYLRMDKFVLTDLLGRIGQLVLVIVFITKSYSLVYLIFALVVGSLINFALTLFWANKYVKIKLEYDFKYWQKILKASIPLGIASVLTMIYFKLDTVMISLFKDQADVGIYGLSYKILESLIFFPAMFVGLIMPLMSRYAVESMEQFKKITQKTLDILIIFIVPLVVATTGLSSRIINLIAGSDFAQSAKVLNILIWATAIIFLAVLFSNMIIALDKQKTLVYIYGLGAFINVVANLIFIPKYSYLGAAGTTLFTEVVVTLLMLWVLFKNFKITFSYHYIFKPFLAAIAMALALYVFANLHIAALLVMSPLVYFVFLYLFGGLTKSDILALFNK